MTGDLEPGRESPLPPFVARQANSSRPDGEARPLPPWTSRGRSLGADPLPYTATPADPADEDDVWDISEPGEHPAMDWTGGTTGDVHEAEDEAHEAHEAQASLDPWAAAEPLDQESDDEPWLLDAAGDNLDDDRDDQDLDDAASHAGWLEITEEEVVVEIGPNEPWSSDAPHGDLALLSDAVDDDAAFDQVEPDDPTAASEPATVSPIDELVVTAGQALGDASDWSDEPQTAERGENTWDAVAAGFGSTPVADDDIERTAQSLERLAHRLRLDGWDSMQKVDGDRLTAALAAFVAGYRAGRTDD